MRDPETPEEWVQQMANAVALLHLDAARQYGLVTGGPSINVARCEEFIERGQALGYKPTPEQIETALRIIVRIGGRR